MSGYLARLLTRAAPLDLAATAPPGGEVRPAAVDAPRGGADPFETTIVDPPEWPSPTRSDVAGGTPPIVTPPLRDPIAEPDHARQSPPPIAPPRPILPPPPVRDRGVAPPSSAEPIDEITIAQTLRPAPPAEPEQPAPVADVTPPAEPELADDRLAIADRFMSGVLPPALLPPSPARIEKTREIVREHGEVRALPLAMPAPAIEPAAPPFGSEPDLPAATGLVIGRLSVTVVPPAAATAHGSTPQPPAAPRVVVVRNSGAAAAGVPSFSRFG